MHRKPHLIITFLSALFTTGHLYAQTTPPPAANYTPAADSFVPDISYPFLQKLIDTAKKHYPEVKVKSTQVGIARTTYHQTQISWFDVITPSYIYNPQNSLNVVTPSVFNGYQIAITLNLGTLIAKPYVIHAAKQNVDVAIYQQQEYLMNLEANVKKLYFTYLGLQADLRLRSKAEQDAGVNVNLMKYKFTKGETTLKDYNDALIIQYTQVSYRIQAELAVFNAKVNLEEMVGKKLEDIK